MRFPLPKKSFFGLYKSHSLAYIKSSEENTLRMIILKEAFSAIPPTTPPHIRDNIAAELAWLGHGQEL
jgi:hypothetical protein